MAIIGWYHLWTALRIIGQKLFFAGLWMQHRREQMMVEKMSMCGSTGQQHRSVIVGNSVHNVRIERLWRDVCWAVVNMYREVFSRLESEHLLDQDNVIDIFGLHEVFTARINKSLTEFVESWHKSLNIIRGMHDAFTPIPWSDHVEVPSIRCRDLKFQLNQTITEMVMMRTTPSWTVIVSMTNCIVLLPVEISCLCKTTIFESKAIYTRVKNEFTLHDLCEFYAM